ncbi:MAG: hypothetical protein J7L62_01750 [Candidatus Aminicenantes bacterium]|nr:hypothetical protein [Candidatus Aminicenantes bacterium]
MIQKTNFYKIKLKIGEVELEIEGDKEFVVEKFEEMRSILPKNLKEYSAGVIETKKTYVEEGVKKRQRKTAGPIAFDIQKVKNLIKEKKLKTPIEKAAAILHHFSKELGIESLKTKDLNNALSQIGAKVKNIYFELKKNEESEEPLLEKVGRGEWKLTGKGKSLFE